MALFHDCDRCHFQEKITTANTIATPSGWSTVNDVTLCPKCTRQLDEFLKPLPIIMEEPTVYCSECRTKIMKDYASTH